MARRNSRITDPISNENTNFSEKYTKIPSEDNVYPVKSAPTELPYVPHIGIGNHTTYDEDEFYTEEEKKIFQDEIQTYEEINLHYDYDDLQEKYKDLVKKNNELKNEIEEIKKQRSNDAQDAQQSEENHQISKKRLNKNKSKPNKSPEQKMIDQLQQSLDLKENQIQDLEKEKKELDLKNDDLYQKNTSLEDELRELHKTNAILVDEASKYQSALGVVTNFQLKDDDQNHSVKLNCDITDLNDDIKTYVTNLKGEISVNMSEVKRLLTLYKCPAEITNQKRNRLLLQAVLHRHVLETIISYALQYFEQADNLEAEIVKRESLLSELLTETSKCRVGNDEITRVGPTKLRQQIYSILSNRGFADVINDNNAHVHPFIQCHKEQLNKEMNKLRNIKDDDKRTFSENMAADIIRNVVKIFWFRLKVQEPVADFDWIPNNTKVDQAIMETNQTNEEEEDSYVDLCYFPLIGRELNTNNQKIYTHAKVITRKSPYSQIQERTLQHQERTLQHQERTLQHQDHEPLFHKQKTNSENQESPNKQKTNSEHAPQQETKQKGGGLFRKLKYFIS